MIDMGSLQAAGASLKAAADIATGLLNLKIGAEVQGKVVELQREIIAAQASAMSAQADQFKLVERVRELEENIRQFETWETEKKRYHLQAVDRGAFAYTPKPEVQGTEPPHWLCATCFEKRHKSFLQFREQLRNPGGSRGDHSRWVCGTCKSELTVHYNTHPISK